MTTIHTNYTFADVRARDVVTFHDGHGSVRTGRAQPLLCNPQAGTIVLNMGGRYGTPAVVTVDNFIRSRRPA